MKKLSAVLAALVITMSGSAFANNSGSDQELDELYFRFVTSSKIVDTCIAEGMAPSKARPMFDWIAYQDSQDLFDDRSLQDYEAAQQDANEFLAKTDSQTLNQYCDELTAMVQHPN
ncbi:hypothetical protein [Paraferrimonas sedimenticola]|uniref:Uncharacterized protein n=1 Tax=Paraferrimonas sedimenticola TaxID=375674 RepID=A0AA37W231_9GAMM|nr:hypothetical protein [Paraferrimonas sedimenticola]GLP97257.1 hypothetical protein GCM10007895_25640 [Paraferrimonas sedimenticola]